ncbi:MAG: hypothetical protein QF824_02280 [Candidatus Woesearchaeota archaeon]|jgi:hypothetical protein|nr:hypothetical protein [Candidatus Woesearchaeota archaeon]
MKRRIKILIFLPLAFIVFAILHNLVDALFGVEEAIFFILSLLSALGFIISIIYNIIILIKNVSRKTKTRTKKTSKS